MRLGCSEGSGSNTASRTVLDDAIGRLAHQKWSVEGCPCRIDFSRTACLDTSAIGKSTSARRLHSRGITGDQPAGARRHSHSRSAHRPAHLYRSSGPRFHNRTVNRCVSATRSGSVPLWARIPGIIFCETPMPYASTYP